MRIPLIFPMILSTSCVELLKAIDEELENAWSIGGDNDGNGIADVHESVLTITKNSRPVNRAGIYGDSDHVLCAINSYREAVCIHDFLAVAKTGILTDKNSAVVGEGLKSITKIRGWTADERTTPVSFAPFVAGITEYDNLFTNYWGPPEDDFWELSSGRHLYVTHGSYDNSSYTMPNGQITLQTNSIAVVYEGSRQMEDLIHNQDFQQLDLISFSRDNVVYAGVSAAGEAVFGSYYNLSSDLGLPDILDDNRVLQTEIFATSEENVNTVQAAIDEYNRLVVWQNDDLQYGPEPEILGDYVQMSSSGMQHGQSSGNKGYLCGVSTEQTLECFELVWDDINFVYSWNSKLVPSGEFLQVEVEEELICAIRTDSSVDCWEEDAPQDLVTIPELTSIGF